MPLLSCRERVNVQIDQLCGSATFQWLLNEAIGIRAQSAMTATEEYGQQNKSTLPPEQGDRQVPVSRRVFQQLSHQVTQLQLSELNCH